MNLRTCIFSLCSLFCVPAVPIQAQTAVPDRFKKLDKNSDGTLNAAEVAAMPSLTRLLPVADLNKDGGLSRDELRKAAERFPPLGQLIGDKPSGESSATKPAIETREMLDFEFTQDYFPGRDVKGEMMSGSELMRLTAYRGQLFAATSMFRDPWMKQRYDGYTGCQVLRKESSSGAWQVDVSFGPRFLRTDALEAIRFTRDANGRELQKPVDMLVAGIWDLGERGSQKDRHITLAVRDDGSGKWTLSKVAPVPDGDRGFASIRAMRVHRDRVSGIEYLVVGAAHGGIFKGVFDPDATGRLRWVGGDEVDASFGRPVAFAEANGSLYASFDYGGITVQNQKGGIFRRVDGPKPRWEQVYRNYNPKFARWNQVARGLTAVPAEDGSCKEVLLAALESIPEPIIIRIEPHQEHLAVTEINWLDLFTGVFGGTPSADESGLAAAALNRFEPFINPATGATGHFVTTSVRHPDDPAPGRNGAYFLIRREAGRYDWAEVKAVPSLTAGGNLRGMRTIEKSPFANEPNVYYFGGYTAGIVEEMQSGTAWIYKGTLKEKQP